MRQVIGGVRNGHSVAGRSCSSLPLQQLLNSYSEILLNPEKDAVNREAAGPLNCPAKRAAGLQDLPRPGTSRESFSPHRLGGATDCSWALTLPPSQGSRPPCPGICYKRLGSLQGCGGAVCPPAAAPGQGGVRPPVQRSGGGRVKTPTLGPNRDDAIAPSRS